MKRKSNEVRRGSRTFSPRPQRSDRLARLKDRRIPKGVRREWLVVIMVLGLVCAVGLITRDQYNFRLRAPQLELDLGPAELPAPKQLAEDH